MTLLMTTMPSPVGPLHLTARAGRLTGVYFEAHKHGGPPPATIGAADILDQTRRQLEAYFTGRRTRFDLPLAPEGTLFQQQVWALLLKIPYGETVTYGWLAAQLDRPDAARAVGAAVGRNPISIIAPCHRVVGANGALTGFAGGLERKAWLLSHETGAPPLV